MEKGAVSSARVVRSGNAVRALLLLLAGVTAAFGCYTLDDQALTGGDRHDGGALAESGAPGDAGGPAATLDAGDATPDEGGSNVDGYKQAILADNPIVYLRLGDGVGTVAKAKAGSDGVYSVGGVVQGAAGAVAGGDTAVTFTDGSGRLTISADAGFPGSAPFSVELWAKPSASSNTPIGMIVDDTDWNDRTGWDMLAGTNSVGLERWMPTEAGSGGSVAIGDAISAGVWHHLVGTFDGANQRFYVDGALVATSGGIALPDHIGTLTIGHQGCACGGSNAYVGDVDEFAIYGTALTSAQITAHFAAAK